MSILNKMQPLEQKGLMCVGESILGIIIADKYVVLMLAFT